jgi:hypothetical protein
LIKKGPADWRKVISALPQSRLQIVEFAQHLLLK